MATRPPTSGLCPSAGETGHDWVEFEGRCYMFFDLAVTFAVARQECSLINSELTSIHNNNTNAFIQSMIQIPSFDSHWWIGMIRAGTSLVSRHITLVKIFFRQFIFRLIQLFRRLLLATELFHYLLNYPFLTLPPPPLSLCRRLELGERRGDWLH